MSTVTDYPTIIASEINDLYWQGKKILYLSGSGDWTLVEADFARNCAKRDYRVTAKVVDYEKIKAVDLIRTIVDHQISVDQINRINKDIASSLHVDLNTQELLVGQLDDSKGTSYYGWNEEIEVDYK